MPSKSASKSTVIRTDSLLVAVVNSKVEEVERIVSVKWDRVKRRRIESAILPGFANGRPAIGYIATLLCLGQDRTKDIPEEEFNKRIRILDLVLENGGCKNNHVEAIKLLFEQAVPKFTLAEFFCLAQRSSTLQCFMTVAKHAGPEVWTELFMDPEEHIDDILSTKLEAEECLPEIIQFLYHLPEFRVWKCTTKTAPDSQVGQQCSICLEKFTQGDDVQKITILRCGHVFHEECMLTVARMKDVRCPYCRQVYL